jgi:hypothetical protein
MKRYKVCAFPSLYGTPVRTNFKFIACIIAVIRKITSMESRVIDTKTGEHILII